MRHCLCMALYKSSSSSSSSSSLDTRLVDDMRVGWYDRWLAALTAYKAASSQSVTSMTNSTSSRSRTTRTKRASYQTSIDSDKVARRTKWTCSRRSLRLGPTMMMTSDLWRQCQLVCRVTFVPTVTSVIVQHCYRIESYRNKTPYSTVVSVTSRTEKNVWDFIKLWSFTLFVRKFSSGYKVTITSTQVFTHLKVKAKKKAL